MNLVPSITQIYKIVVWIPKGSSMRTDKRVECESRIRPILKFESFPHWKFEPKIPCLFPNWIQNTVDTQLAGPYACYLPCFFKVENDSICWFRSQIIVQYEETVINVVENQLPSIFSALMLDAECRLQGMAAAHWWTGYKLRIIIPLASRATHGNSSS